MLDVSFALRRYLHSFKHVKRELASYEDGSLSLHNVSVADPDSGANFADLRLASNINHVFKMVKRLVVNFQGILDYLEQRVMGENPHDHILMIA